MLLSGPALYALVLIMAAALVVPAVFSVDTNVRDFSVESYKNMQLRQLYAQLESGAYAQDSDGVPYAAAPGGCIEWLRV